MAYYVESIPYYNPYYDERFRDEPVKNALWLSSTKGPQVIDALWVAISRAMYEGDIIEYFHTKLQSDIGSILKEGNIRRK